QIGVETGQMMTMDDLDEESYRKAMAKREDRHWVYKREGLPCRVCGTHIVMEELGRRVAPTPFLGAAVLAPTALLTVGADGLLKDLGSEAVHAALIVPVTTDPTGQFPGSVRLGPDGRLTGRVGAVVDVVDAAHHIVPALDVDGRPCLLAVAADDARVRIVEHTSLDLTRPVVAVEYNAAAVTTTLAGGEVATAAVRAALVAGAGLLASEQLGIAEYCLDTTVKYLGERRQFGRIVGSYQALKHRLADLWVEIGGARAVARQAVAMLTEAGPRMSGYLEQGSVLRQEIDLAVTLAQYQCSAVAVRAAEEAVQLHGGVGMTWELPLHLSLKRAKADQLAFGSAGTRFDRLAELVDLPGPAR
ncbi:MAG: hypothetical protein J0I40_13650, partial [Cellulomonas sp.]|nr:hypothetical protein [Cellulomonas sp.]